MLFSPAHHEANGGKEHVGLFRTVRHDDEQLRIGDERLRARHLAAEESAQGRANSLQGRFGFADLAADNGASISN